MEIDETIPDAYPSTQKITANKIIQLTAIPQYGYQFVGWSGDSVDLTETISITMTCAKEFTANFVPLTYKISVFSSPSSGGEVVLKPLQPEDGYPAGTNVTITAKPAPGYIFKEWSGTALNTKDNTFIYVAYADKSITAVFVEKPTSNSGWIIGGVIAGIIVIGVLLYLFIFRKRPTK